MYAVQPLISAQFLMMLFHHNSLSAPKIATNSTATDVGRSVREDMLWLNDVYSGMPDDPLVDFPWSSGYSNAIRLLSCSQERANGIYIWQCFEKPYLVYRYKGIFSKKYCQDMLSQFVPEHHDGKTPLQLSAINLAYALAGDLPDMPQNMEMMIVSIIECGADLHEALHSYTPFALFLRSIASTLRYRSYASSRPRDLRRMLKGWLNILQRSGVDLVTYGAEESRTHVAPCSIENPTQPWDWSYFAAGDQLYYFAFSYGSMPSDWTVQFDMVEEYASDFWRMPGLLGETEVRAIPGSWIDS
jgi:hypothetical protein